MAVGSLAAERAGFPGLLTVSAGPLRRHGGNSVMRLFPNVSPQKVRLSSPRVDRLAPA